MNRIGRIALNRQVQAALESFKNDYDSFIELAIAIQQIPSPTGAESELAKYIADQFRELGLMEVTQDSLHNTFARLPGQSSKCPIVVSAHTDTVFPSETDLSVKFQATKQPGLSLIYGPGLADNALGVAGLLILAKTLKEFGIQTPSDVWFVGNVGEEGLGNLSGMRATVDRFGNQASYIVLEGGSFGHIFHQAIGVERFEILVQTMGGHSWGDFGSTNAIHVLSRLVSEIDRLELPSKPKTTLNVGVIQGGTTVNTIAARASCLLDLRSISPRDLDLLVDDVKDLVQKTVGNQDAQVKMTQIGKRPAGIIPQETALVVWAADALREVGTRHPSFTAGSTDANIPISRGIPAVCIGLAKAGHTHRVDEFLDPTHLPEGLGQLLLLVLAATGFEG